VPVDEEEFKLFVCERQKYYWLAFKQFEETEKYSRWNWAACLLSPAWFFYRRMYLYGLLSLLVLIASTFLEKISEPLAFMIQIVSLPLFGLLGSYFYYTHAKDKIRTIKNTIHDPELQKKKIAEAGGTSWSAALLTVLAVIVGGMISYFLGI